MKYFKPNWHAINKSIEEGQLKELRAEENELKKKIQAKIDLHFKQKREQEFADKVKALKELPADATVYYIGRSNDIPFAAEGRKVFVVRNGNKRMQVEFAGKVWTCYYQNLQIKSPTEQQISSNKISTRLTNLVNGIL